MIHTIKNDCLSVSVSERGAELASIKGRDGFEYLWQGDANYWSGRAPNLFPFVARLYNGKYKIDGETHEMERHGFVRRREFTAIEKADDSMTLEFTWDEDSYKIYPRKFKFRVNYKLVKNTLEVTFEVENLDEKLMYFGLGAHPGFNVPMRDGKRFEDYRIAFPKPSSPQRVGFTPDRHYTTGDYEEYPLKDGRYIYLTHDLFDLDAVVLRNIDRIVTIETEGDDRSVTVSFPGMQYVGFWHMDHTDAPYVCVEPWCSLPAADGKATVFEEKEDLLRCKPGEVYSNTWTITINGN